MPIRAKLPGDAAAYMMAAAGVLLLATACRDGSGPDDAAVWTPKPGQFLVRMTGAINVPAARRAPPVAWAGSAQSVEVLGMTQGIARVNATSDDLRATLSVHMRSTLQVGQQQLVAAYPQLRPQGAGSGNGDPTASLWIYDEHGRAARLFDTTSGTLTITFVQPASGPGHNDGFVRGEIALQATGYLVTVSGVKPWLTYTYTPTDQTLSLEGAFDVPLLHDIFGSATVAVTGGPYPGEFIVGLALAQTYGAAPGMDLSISGSAGTDVGAHAAFQLAAPGTGTFAIGESGIAGKLEYHDADGRIAGDADSGTIYVVEYQPPPEYGKPGIARGSFELSVPLIRYTNPGMESAGTATVSATFHVPVRRPAWAY